MKCMNDIVRRQVYTPHSYQRNAIDYVMSHPRCLLAMDMGLGKTSVVLYSIRQLIRSFSISRVLIIAPLYVASSTWPAEVQKWDFSRDLSIRSATGSAAERKSALESDTDIVTINRENVIWLCETYGSGLANRFDMIVIDESSSFKSYSSKRFKRLKRITPLMDRVIELSGTPRPRSIEDLWSQIFLLDGGQRLEKSMSAFRTRYEYPGRRNGYTIYEWKLRDDADTTIYNRIADVSFSMSAPDYLDVPPVQIIDHRFTLPPTAQKTYRTFEKDSIAHLGDSDIVGPNAGAVIGKLLQMANGAVYDDSGKYEILHDEKLKILEEILESTEDPVMVFYWYRHDYERLNQYFASYHPETIETANDIGRWNKRQIRLLLVHPASMGHGLNLQDGGHIIVWFGLSWSLEITQQANARLHRQGQKSTVQIHRIIAEHTADEDVIRSLEHKDTGQNELISAIRYRVMNGGDQSE